MLFQGWTGEVLSFGQLQVQPDQVFRLLSVPYWAETNRSIQKPAMVSTIPKGMASEKSGDILGVKTSHKNHFMIRLMGKNPAITSWGW